MSDPTVELPSEAVALVDEKPLPLDRPLPIDELHRNLEYIRQVMAREMKEGQDYGKIPGCGDKPGLFQPGAQKLLMTFQLTPHVKREVLRELPHPSIVGHREYEFTICVRSQTGREWDGVGTCSTLETKYRYRGGSRKCPNCGKEAIIKGKAEYGGGWLCFAKKGGCGTKWPNGAQEIEGQSVDKVENDNPAEYWNTVRKMGFKRAIVHAAINATNTSELWSQDLEDLPRSEPVNEYIPTEPAQQEFPPPSPPKKATDKFRMRALNQLKAAPGQPNRDTVARYLHYRHWLEEVMNPESWVLEHVPTTKEELSQLTAAIQTWDDARHQPATTEELI